MIQTMGFALYDALENAKAAVAASGGSTSTYVPYWMPKPTTTAAPAAPSTAPKSTTPLLSTSVLRALTPTRTSAFSSVSSKSGPVSSGAAPRPVADAPAYAPPPAPAKDSTKLYIAGAIVVAVGGLIAVKALRK